MKYPMYTIKQQEEMHNLLERERFNLMSAYKDEYRYDDFERLRTAYDFALAVLKSHIDYQIEEALI